MRHLELIFIMAILVGPPFVRANGTSDYGWDVEPARLSQWPRLFDNYQLLPESQSPDDRYGFIYPKRTVVEEITERKLFLIEQKPFRNIVEIPIQNALLANNAHGSYGVNWAADSSSVVFIVGIKWGPKAVFVVPFKSGVLGKIVNLESEVKKLVQASYEQSKAPRFNDWFDFIFDDEDFIRDAQNSPVDTTTYWTPDHHGQVLIKCICTSDPKHLSKSVWEVVFQGTWDIARAQFVQHEFTVIPQVRLAPD